jgi:hypothetical protein
MSDDEYGWGRTFFIHRIVCNLPRERVLENVFHIAHRRHCPDPVDNEVFR